MWLTLLSLLCLCACALLVPRPAAAYTTLKAHRKPAPPLKKPLLWQKYNPWQAVHSVDVQRRSGGGRGGGRGDARRKKVKPVTIGSDGGMLEATYYSSFYVGSEEPKTQVTVALDTGSDVFAFVSEHCTTDFGDVCPSSERERYNPDESSTSKALTCTDKSDCCLMTYCCKDEYECVACGEESSDCIVSLSYGDGATSRGTVYSDLVSFVDVAARNGTEPFTAYFAAISREDGSFSSFTYDGLVGLSYDTFHGVPLFIDQYVKTNKGEARQFALCMGETDGGEFNFGTIDDSLYEAPLVWLDRVDPNNETFLFWNVDLAAIGVKGIEAHDVEMIPAMVDSGTTLLYVNVPIFDEIQRQFNAFCSLPDTPSHVKDILCDASEGIIYISSAECRNFNEEDFALFPDMTFTFGEGEEATVLKITPREYIRFQASGNMFHDFCGSLGIESDPYLDQIIMGDTFMRRFLTVFDADNERIGFGTANAAACGERLVGKHVNPWYAVAVAVSVLVLCMIGGVCCMMVRRRRSNRILLRPTHNVGHVYSPLAQEEGDDNSSQPSNTVVSY